MSRRYRVVSMILVFSVLTSADMPARASLRGHQVDIPRHREGIERERVPAALSPPWQPGASDLPGRVGGGGQESQRVGPIEPELLRALLEAESNGNGDEYVRVVVYLHEQADLDAAVSRALSVTEARSRVVSALRARADHSQAPLRAYLEGARAAGLVESYTPFWIFNGIAVRARPSLVYALVAHPAVAAVRLDHWRQWIPDETGFRIQNPGDSGLPEWGVARIRADQVWASLRISGTGAIVAGMDTGVDWLHPALQANYRGYNPHGPSNHAYSWHDATGVGALYPVDGHGHGSHTMGTIVGKDGIGVAPGARWIAVKAIDQRGYAYDSWLHEGFQWILAPGGDPTKAPDVVNNSWGYADGSLTIFQPDLEALRAAGILPVFSGGNAGPADATVSSPASLPGAFAVGATDSEDEVAYFSSRGPSPWGEVRPHVAAPGVNVHSSLPGGIYGVGKGTSMAAPHVAGIVALLRSVSSTLSVTRTAFIITSTAVPLTDAIPNNDSGWGRVDAFAAVAALSQPGFVTGTVTRAGNDAPIAGASVVATPHAGQGGGGAVTDDNGSYRLALAPATYDLTASAFGYEQARIWGAVVLTDTTTVLDFSLTPLPSGSLRACVSDAAVGAPVTATVTVLDTPLEVTDDVYTFTLPEGTYTVRARALGYRVVTTTACVTAGHLTVVDLALPPAPSVLLVDSGLWYYQSQVDYFRQALDDLGLAYDVWPIGHLPAGIPAGSDLVSYDVVIWSAPFDAPGYIGAEGAIVDYLSGGGRLLLTGQDIGFLDGGGTMWYRSPYYSDYLKARYVSDGAPTRVLKGLGDDIFAGVTITITGPGGANNQDLPDEIEIADPDAAAPILVYDKGGCGGLRAGTCLNYRVVYLSFGFEAINDRAARQEVMDRALEWLTSPPPTVGLEMEPASQLRIGLPNSLVTHTLRVRHVGQGGATDVIRLSLNGGTWETQLGVSSLPLSPCTSASVVVTVSIPPMTGWDAQDVVTLTARSSLSPTLTQDAVLVTKAPAPILLVDDDRWKNQEARYEAALTSAGLPYDYWRVGWFSREPSWGSPPLKVLQRYLAVVWFTGYDWYQPVTADEAAALAAYLDGGGRLFLTSQDFLYYHHDTSLSQDYLGVVDYAESVTPTMASGAPGETIGDRLGPYVLDYPFANLSDAVVPGPGVAVSFYDQDHLPIALARQAQDYKVVFFSFPYEALPEAGRTEVMERTIGWLSWLGGSTFSADRETVSSGETLAYTITLRNDGPEAVSTLLSNTLPLSLTMVPSSLTGSAIYSPSTRRVSWEGQLGAGAAVTFTYRVTVAAGAPVATPIVNTARLGLKDQDIYFDRDAVSRVNAPDLSPSALWCDPCPARPGTVVACTLTLANAGSGDAVQATATSFLPADTTLVPGSPSWVGGGTVQVPTGTVKWIGPLSAGSQVTLTYQLTLPSDPAHPPMYGAAYLEDGVGGAWERATWLIVEPLRCYLPLVLRRL